MQIESVFRNVFWKDADYQKSAVNNEEWLREAALGKAIPPMLDRRLRSLTEVSCFWAKGEMGANRPGSGQDQWKPPELYLNPLPGQLVLPSGAEASTSYIASGELSTW